MHDVFETVTQKIRISFVSKTEIPEFPSKLAAPVGKKRFTVVSEYLVYETWSTRNGGMRNYSGCQNDLGIIPSRVYAA